MTPAELQRFESKVHVEPNTGCWLWTAAVTRRGYGQFCVGVDMARAHRVAYEHFKGPIPESLHVCHRCDTPQCVNPDHLWLGTNAANTADRVSKGRGVCIPAERRRAHTHCLNGHEYTPENTRRTANGSRACRKCAAAASRRYKVSHA